LKIIVTGGTGYIGSHTVVDLISNEYEVIVLDSCIRSSSSMISAMESITNTSITFHQIDLTDENKTIEILNQYNQIAGIIHFAALKEVGESVEKPLLYFQNNLNSLITMLKCVEIFNIPNFVFSSSCSVFGNIDTLPVSEDSPMNPTQSPYASTKVMGEKIIEDFSKTSTCNFINLRYFNPVGAHHSNLIGESPTTIPNNVLPRITGTALGKFEEFKIFGTDYPTRDGTCIRDYIHVEDIAEAHTAALKLLIAEGYTSFYEIINIGSGNGVSVLELIDAFEKTTGVSLKKNAYPRREGDVIAVYADNSKAKKILNWSPKRTVEDMLMSAWEWDQKITLSQTHS
jgi:UDP-glucose 4-epimerase